MQNRMPQFARWGLVLTLLGAMIASSYGSSNAAAQAPTTSHTSAAFGYTITWDASWQLNDQSDDGISDSLSLVDGSSFVYFSGQNDGSDAKAAVENFSGFLRDDESYVDVQPLSECPGGDRALPSVTACFTFQRVYETGEVAPEAALLEAWDLGDGARLLMVATVPQELFATYLPKWAAFGIMPADVAGAGTALGFAELEGVTFTFDPGVTDADRADVIEGIRLGQDVITRYLGLERLEEIQVNVLETASPDRPDAVAATLGFYIEVYAGGEAWQYAPG